MEFEYTESTKNIFEYWNSEQKQMWRNDNVAVRGGYITLLVLFTTPP